MITFVGWKWHQQNHRTTYTAEHANIWRSMIDRYYKEPHRVVLITDDPRGVNFETFPLWQDCGKLINPSGAHLPSCYRRLKIFDPLVLAEMDVEEGEYVVSLDLDVVIVNDIRTMINRYDGADFVGWKGIGAYNPVVYNGTLFKFRAGRMSHLWRDFDPVRSPIEANQARFFGSDQGWLSYRLRGEAPGWTAESDGVLSYTTHLHGIRARGARHMIPSHARIISFNGKRKPWEASVQQSSPWIRNHWYA